MQFGVQLPEIEYQATWAEMRAMAETVEAVGLDAIWVGDHLLYEDDGVRRGPWEAWSLLAGLAAVTSRVRIGPLVAALPFHHPAVLAKAAVAVDSISGSRLVFGVGAGWNQLEFEAFGLPYDRRVDRFAEAFTIVRRLLDRERVDFDGEFYQLAGAELIPPPIGQIPMMIGSNRPRMLSLALPHVLWWNTWYSGFDNDVERLPALLDSIDQACVRADREPRSLLRSVGVYLGFGESAQRRTGGTPWWGSEDDHLSRLEAMATAGVDEVIGILDPITAESIEKFGAIAARFRATR